MDKKEFWEFKLLDAQAEFIEAEHRYHKELERYMYSVKGKETPKMSKIYNDWLGIQPRGKCEKQ